MTQAMMEREPVAGNRINWPFAIAASVVCHAAVLGVVLLAGSGGSPDAAAERDGVRRGAEQTAGAEAERADGGGEASGRAGASDSAALAAGGEGGGAPAAPETATYVVRGGDNLTKIARRHGCTAEDLAALNGFAVNKPLNIGEKLKVPAQAAQ